MNYIYALVHWSPQIFFNSLYLPKFPMLGMTLFGNRWLSHWTGGAQTHYCYPYKKGKYRYHVTTRIVKPCTHSTQYLQRGCGPKISSL